jgi:hypothetical protein
MKFTRFMETEVPYHIHKSSPLDPIQNHLAFEKKNEIISDLSFSQQLQEGCVFWDVMLYINKCARIKYSPASKFFQ